MNVLGELLSDELGGPFQTVDHGLLEATLTELVLGI